MLDNRFKLAVVGFLLLCVGILLLYKGINSWALISDLSREIISEVNPTPQTSVENQIDLETKTSTVSAQFTERAKVVKVIDGDTIEVLMNGQNLKIRYIGVDTPETVDPRRGVQCFGKQASDENKQLVEGKEVFLEKDVSETDKYNRLLRYVYLPINEGSLLFVNDYLVRAGFAKSSTYPPDVKHQERFSAAQKEAQEKGLGLWNQCN